MPEIQLTKDEIVAELMAMDPVKLAAVAFQRVNELDAKNSELGAELELSSKVILHLARHPGECPDAPLRPDCDPIYSSADDCSLCRILAARRAVSE